jgi:hypothetical protein
MAVFPGVLLILTGILTIQFYWPVVLILFGWLLALSRSGVTIDTQKREIRFYQNWLGIFKTGKTKSLNLYHGITLIPVKTVSGMASWSNRSTGIVEHDYRIFLVNHRNRPDAVIKICKTRDEAQRSIDELSLWLKMTVYSLK